MSAPAVQIDERPSRAALPSRICWASLLGIACVVLLLHVLTNGRYGFHRDELQFLSDARHLDWGFVSYPPLTPFAEHISLAMFGLSLVGLRLFSAVAQAIAIVVSGLIARELGGGRLAQATAALAVAFSPLPLFEGTEFQYTSFEFLWLVLIAYFVIRLLRTENPRWWLTIGACVGLGLQTKYAIVFFIAGILGGLALTRARRFFISGWFWGGVAIAALIFLPNFTWLVRHDFISYRFLQHIHARDVGQGRADGFLKDQLMICINVDSSGRRWIDFVPAGYALPDAGVDVHHSFCAVLVRQGARLLCGRWVSDAAGDGSSRRRTLACAASKMGTANCQDRVLLSVRRHCGVHLCSGRAAGERRTAMRLRTEEQW